MQMDRLFTDAALINALTPCAFNKAYMPKEEFVPAKANF
ncbi:hypothetical protein Dacet_0528 [Denitrovibrio acetiphilus DSM 12809]|uniref:Uncharacterized protein n=1 Tax=Denitrovibrio acetiphilus (strain DSM 12809 / NBRC 114555 / N2460) TaxID=522772 RepID=D4H415_DENA2|nr:hypothetical protein Dacet_0528 [Denitrovibrio acetiphilus DSM 12809]